MPQRRLMSLKRRGVLAAGAACLLPDTGWAQSRRVVTDAAGRKVELPAIVERVHAAGPPASILYPQAFPEELRPVVRDFYTRCYHQAPSEAQLDQLLRPA